MSSISSNPVSSENAVTITRRTRNLGYALTTRCEQTRGGLNVVHPTAPEFVGTPKQVLEEAYRQRGLYAGGGTAYREVLFVGGKKVTRVGGCDPSVSDLAAMLEHGNVEVQVSE